VRLTQEHGYAFGYWRTPTMIRVACKLRRPDIDVLVNAHAGLRLSSENHNALHLLRMRLRNGQSPLQALQPSCWDAVHAKGRDAMFRRWRNKLLNVLRSQGRA
jgi:hypothetical protein